MLNTAIAILNIIEENSFEAYIVGGFVRDYLMGKKSNDVDITTNAKPKDLIKIFPTANIENAFYGTVTVYYNGIKFEITTYRNEENYIDNRHPDIINYVNDLKTDLKRRDFTINTICMDKERKIIDIYNAREDLDNKIIKTINNPLKSFKIDSLRILRAIRFATTLDFSLDQDVEDAIKQSSYMLSSLSVNRKKEELDKIFSSPNIEKGLELIKRTGLVEVLQLQNINKLKKCSQVIGIWTILEVDDLYNFTRNELKLMKDIRIAMKKGPLSSKSLYYNDLYPCIVAGELLEIDKKQIMDVYNDMPIKKRSDIQIDSQEIVNNLKISNGPILRKIWEDVENTILNLELPNEKNKILEFIKAKYYKDYLIKEDINESKSTS